MKPLPGSAGAEIIPPKLLDELLVTVDHAVPAANLGLRGVSPSSAYCLFRKQGRSSTSYSGFMTHLLLPGRAHVPNRGSQSLPDVPEVVTLVLHSSCEVLGMC